MKTHPSPHGLRYKGNQALFVAVLYAARPNLPGSELSTVRVTNQLDVELEVDALDSFFKELSAIGERREKDDVEGLGGGQWRRAR